eukprot:Rmarinus@m.16973
MHAHDLPDSATDFHRSVTRFVNKLTVYNGCMSASSLNRAGLARDPFFIPFEEWVRQIASIVIGREILAALVLLCRVFNIVWEKTDAKRTETMIRPLTLYNRHRALLVAVILSNKFYSDAPVCTGYWVRFVNFWDVPTLRALELKFLKALHWRVSIEPDDFNRFLNVVFGPHSSSREALRVLDQGLPCVAPALAVKHEAQDQRICALPALSEVQSQGLPCAVPAQAVKHEAQGQGMYVLPTLAVKSEVQGQSLPRAVPALAAKSEVQDQGLRALPTLAVEHLRSQRAMVPDKSHVVALRGRDENESRNLR